MDKFMLIAWWERDGLWLRPIDGGHLRQIAAEVHSTHTADFGIDPAQAQIRAALFILKTPYLPQDKQGALGLHEASVSFLFESAAQFIEARSRLSPKHRAALDWLWMQSAVLNVFAYHAHRHFRDARARDVFAAMHAYQRRFDVISQSWVSETEKQP